MLLKDTSFIHTLPEIVSIHKETIEPEVPFLDIAARFSNVNGTVLLMSGGNLDCSRYHILGLHPWMTITSKGKRTSILLKGSPVEFKKSPLSLLNKLIKHLRCKEYFSELPVNAGLLGYLAYDLKDQIEKLPQTCLGNNLPDIFLTIPKTILIFDKKKQ